MSIFGSIFNKIFHHGQAQAPAAGAQAQAPHPAQTPQQAQPAPQPAQQPQQPPASQPVDVEAVLTQMASAHAGGGGNWRTSIVDLLKLLDLDSSLQARKELANELNVHVGADGTAEENIALHKAVMRKLAENGGKVPADMRD